MNKSKIGYALLYITAFAIFSFGIVYIYVGFTSGLMPYHVRFLGKTCDELRPEICILMKTFVQIIGFAFISLSIAGFIIIHGISNAQIGSIGLKIIAIALLMLVPIIPIMINLATYTPWYIVKGILVIAFSGLILAKPKGS